MAGLSAAILCTGLLAAQAAGAASSATRLATVPATTTTTAAAGSGAFHQTKTIYRTNLVSGKSKVVDKRTVTLNVSTTTNLIDRQVIKVSWSGAHPTGGIWSNPNDGPSAQLQEYPMVLLECHGNPSSKAPAAQQIQPKDCWTATPTERFFSGDPSQPYPPWRVDQYATAAAQRNLTVNEPNPLPPTCGLFPGPHFWLPYVNPKGTSWAIGPGGCAKMPNEMNLLGGLGLLPSNESFAATGVNGKGSANFDVWTNELNLDMGCSQKVSCALVAVPVMGISCDPAAKGMPASDRPTPAQEPAAAAQCEATGHFPPGSILQQGELGQEDLTVSGQLWWAASNWRNRFVVPLHFAPPANVCSVVNKGNHFVSIYGSGLMDQAALQWQPHFCLNRKLFTLGYVQEGEPEAVGQLQTGTAKAVLVSNQPATAFPEPVVHAPVAATGFAITFVVDDSKGVPVTTLRLDPRLLAKLLTESYPGVTDIANNDPELLHACPGVPVPNSAKCTNPLNITLDPEFQALNPGIPHGVGASAAASVLLSMSMNTDVITALTSYINASPAARAWLNGTPDPWGMTVNSKYKGIKLPVSNWPLLSTFEPQDWISGSGGPYPCYADSPTPALPLIASPVADLPTLAEDMQFYIAQPQLVCVGNPDVPQSLHLVALGPQTVGFRFMIGITTLADAHRYNINTASLLTYTKPGTPTKFTSPAGMTFVAPTNASLSSAAAILTPDKKNLDWTFPYSLYGKDNVKVAKAYPGTMLVYADVPTKGGGLSKQDATDYAGFLNFAATAGQVPGGAVGQLAAGYLPMTAANHLGAEAAYTKTAAAAVAAQKGQVPPLFPAHQSPSPSPTPSGSTSSSPGSTTGGGSGSPSPSSSGGSPSASPSQSQPIVPIHLTPEASFGIAGYLLPVVAGLVLIAVAGALLISWLARRRGSKWS
ncbi:MAG TPA: hypothetical protein VF834_18640 [Streptosporangiaceae bacterium]